MDTWDIASLDLHRISPRCFARDDETRVIAINLPAGEGLQEHQVHERAWLVVASGEIDVEQDGQSVTGGPGFLAHFDPARAARGARASDARLILLLWRPWPGEGHPSRRD